MNTTNDKPGQTPNIQNGNTPKQPTAGATQDPMPTTDKREENKVKDPTTTGPDTKRPTDPNNPQAKSGDAATPIAEQAEVPGKA